MTVATCLLFDGKQPTFQPKISTREEVARLASATPLRGVACYDLRSGLTIVYCERESLMILNIIGRTVILNLSVPFILFAFILIARLPPLDDIALSDHRVPYSLVTRI